MVSNAGGVNPRACAEAVLAVARAQGTKVPVGLVTGDDIGDRIDDLLTRGHELRNLDSGAPLSAIRSRVQAANVYLGMAPVVRALGEGAVIVVSGRLADPVLALGPLFHEFGWSATDWDRVAAGIVAGHIIECGAQSTGGNLLKDWRRVKDLANVGFPIVEVAEDGSFIVTKHPGTGGVVNLAVGHRTAGLRDRRSDPLCERGRRGGFHQHPAPAGGEGPGRRRVGSAERRRRLQYKVSIAYSYGYKAIGTLVYTWPDALDKARAADRIIRERLDALGLRFEKVHTEFVGYNATHGRLAGPPDTGDARSAAPHRRAGGRQGAGGAVHPGSRPAGADRAARRSPGTDTSRT